MLSSLKYFSGIALSVLLVLFTSCGYTFNHKLSERFNHPKGIYVPVFFNVTDEVGAEIAFTNALIRELLSHGEHIVYNESESGLILKGTVQSISYRRTSAQAISPSNSSTLYTYNVIPDQIAVSANVSLTLYETSTKKSLWSQSYTPPTANVSAPRVRRLEERDSPSSFGLITQSKIDSSYSDIARSFASAAYDGMVEIYYGKKQDDKNSSASF